MKTATLGIQGMHCNGCVQAIEAFVRAEPGVRAAEVSFEEGQARILYDPQVISEDQVVEVIERGGFRVPDEKT